MELVANQMNEDMKCRSFLTVLGLAAAVSCGNEAEVDTADFIGNPYLPLWEHVPDGEPRLFEDPDNPGKYRVYVTGSHDTRFESYCGQDDRQWSAPVEDLAAWRDEGPVFSYQENGYWSTVYAPDLVEVTRRDDGSHKYYLFPHALMRMPMVCVGDRPDGPFTPLNADGRGGMLDGSVIGFDPGAFVEQVDDPSDPDYGIGFRAYVAWGFQDSAGTELDQNTMFSPRYGTPDWPVLATEEFNFYEASSFRKVGNKYIFIYSGHSGPEYGLPRDNANLRFAYSDSPRGPWKPGGILVDARGPVLSRDGSCLQESFGHNNTHGSLLEINGQWYVFYHRAPRGFGFARQAMVAPVAIEADEKPVAEGGSVRITAYDPYKGAFTVKAADGFEYTGAEVTSEGFWIYGLPPFRYYSAGYACYMSRPGTMQDSWDVWDNRMDIAGVRAGDILGYKYFALGGVKKAPAGLYAFPGLKKGSQFNLFLAARTADAFKVSVWLDGPWEGGAWNGTRVAEVEVPAGASADVSRYSIHFDVPSWALKGKHALFLVAEGPEGIDLCDIVGFGFSRKGESMEFPQPPSLRLMAAGEPLEMPSHPLWTTDFNGLTDCTNYEVLLPEGVSAADVTVEADPSVTVEQEASLIRCTWKGVTKTYLLR